MNQNKAKQVAATKNNKSSQSKTNNIIEYNAFRSHMVVLAQSLEEALDRGDEAHQHPPAVLCTGHAVLMRGHGDPMVLLVLPVALHS